jgi:hypothetical protein
MLLALAQVRFRTGEADDEQASYSAATVGDAFAGEGSEHFYGYYTQYEDLAMLFEAAQLKRHFDIDAEVASVIKPDGAGSCAEADWLIAWGERRRLASPLTAPRARTAASLLLPDVDWPGLFATINASSPSPDANWCSLRPAYRSLSAFDAIDWQRANRTDPRHLPPLPSQP